MGGRHFSLDLVHRGAGLFGSELKALRLLDPGVAIELANGGDRALACSKGLEALNDGSSAGVAITSRQGEEHND